MMRDRWTERLSEYVDDELASAERQELEQHLGGCAECRELVAELGQVAQRAAALPESAPSHDLWPGVAGRLRPRAAVVRPLRPVRSPRRISFSIPQLAAAAVFLAVGSGGAAWLLRGGRPAPTPAPAAIAQAPDAGRPGSGVQQASAHAVPARTTESYASAVAELEQVLREGQGKLDPRTVQVLERNLAVINQALLDAQSALSADPQNAYLSTHLAETMQQKAALLRRAAQLAAHI